MFKNGITESFFQTGKFLKSKNHLIKIPKRMMMLLHEYQAQGLLKKYSVPIPRVIIKK